MDTVVLVEGVSDQLAVEALARRLGRDLAADGVSVVPIGGAQAVGGVAERFAQDVRVAGLCDAGEERVFRRALEHVYVCVADLEDELVRALGAPAVERVLEAQGDLRSFRTMQKQPAWRGEPPERQLRRFFGSSAGKIRYAPLLVEAVERDRVPRPLERLLDFL
jgi:hypothetical protein